MAKYKKVLFLLVLNIIWGMLTVESETIENDKNLLSIPERIIVISYNIHIGKGLDNKLDLERIANVISQADIVGLNEVDKYAPRTYIMNQPGRLAHLTGMNMAFGPAFSKFAVWKFGNVILSKEPILSYRNHLLPRKGKRERRAMLEADLGWLKVFVTHLSLDKEERNKQVDEILRITSNVKGPIILMGDFNAEPNSQEIQKIKRHFIDAGINAGPTIPANNPTCRIDYVFVRNLVPVSASVIDTKASDHRPLKVILKPLKLGTKY